MSAMLTTIAETDRWERLADELRNFHEVAQFLRPSPGDVPRIGGLDLACLALPLHDVVGGDHVAWGDILLLHTDGLSEHNEGDFFPARVEPLLADCGDASAGEICDRLRESLLAEGPANDDVTVVVLKRTA